MFYCTVYSRRVQLLYNVHYSTVYCVQYITLSTVLKGGKLVTRGGLQIFN